MRGQDFNGALPPSYLSKSTCCPGAKTKCWHFNYYYFAYKSFTLMAVWISIELHEMKVRCASGYESFLFLDRDSKRKRVR